MLNVVILMADYGHDPTETTLPYTAFKAAGYNVVFATEAGKAPECDTVLLKGFTQKILGANRTTLAHYTTMTQSPEWKSPIAWTTDGFTLDAYDFVFIPGGHEKSVVQLLDSPIVHRLLVDYFPKTAKPSSKAIGAVCHGVLVLSQAKGEDGRSVIHDATTTALPAKFEQIAFWGTRAFLGDYYKTYGAGSDDVQACVERALDNPAKQYKNSILPLPFVVEDEKYNYISARYPGDVAAMTEKLMKLAKQLKTA